MKENLKGSLHSRNAAKKRSSPIASTTNSPIQRAANVPRLELHIFKPKTQNIEFNIDENQLIAIKDDLKESLAVIHTLQYVGGEPQVHLSFKYNKTLMNLIKAHIPGRSWNPNSKSWVVPGSSLQRFVALFTTLGLSIPETIIDAAQNQSNNSKGDLASRITFVRDHNTGPSHVDVSTTYHFETVARLKQIHPKQRDYDKSTKIWRIDILALPQLLESFQQDGYIVDEAMNQIVDRMVDEILNDTPPPIVEIPQSEVLTQPSSAPVPFSGLPLALTQPSTIKNGPKYSYKREEEKIPPGCDCGSHWSMIAGEHVCRYYGTYRCSCGNIWTSGYTWKGEPQACGSCGLDNMPAEVRQLQKRIVDNTMGPHDHKRCGMCRRLGTFCYLERY